MILGSQALFLGRGKDVVPQKMKVCWRGRKRVSVAPRPNYIQAISHKTAVLNAWHGLISMVVMVITVVMVISDTVTEWLR